MAAKSPPTMAKLFERAIAQPSIGKHSDHAQRSLDEATGEELDRLADTVDERRAATVEEWNKDPEYKAALHAFDHEVREEAMQELAGIGQKYGMDKPLKGEELDKIAGGADLLRERCSHCGKPATTNVCGVGGCPLGGDL